MTDGQAEGLRANLPDVDHPQELRFLTKDEGEAVVALVQLVEAVPDVVDQGEAWVEAQKRLPEGWFIYGVRAAPMGQAEPSAKYAMGLPDWQPIWWNAAARGEDINEWWMGEGPTPAKALASLKAREDEAT